VRSLSSVWSTDYIAQVRSDAFTGNILSPTSTAPALQANQKALEKHMRADSLEHKLQQRPKPEDLIREGILEADENPLKE
jgi:hypothetical protein